MAVLRNTASAAALAVILLVWSQNDGVIAAAAADTTDMMTVAQRTFADELTETLYANENECTSSLGVSMAFSLIYPASVAESREQMQNVFGYPEITTTAADDTTISDPLVWNKASTSLVESYQGKCLFGLELEDGEVEALQADGGNNCQEGQTPLLKIANSVWVRNDVTLDPSYEKAVGSLATQLDFSDAGAGDTLNGWVEDQTNGLIDSIVKKGPLPSNWILVAINAIYLKAAWQAQFQERLTNQDVFYTSALRTVETDKKARFMHQVDYFDYSDTALPGFQVVRLAFAGDNELSRGLSMVFVLPNNSLEQQELVTSEELWSQLSELKSTKVALALPRFRFESTYSTALKSALMATGLVAPFDGGLCVRDGDCSAAVDHVVQKTVIDVNEEGVEAAAVTLVAVVESVPAPKQPILFQADHPFQFFIYDDNEEVFLFEGLVSNPGEPDGVPDQPALQASHKDADFWQTNLYEDPIVVPLSDVVFDEPDDGVEPNGGEVADPVVDGEPQDGEDTDPDDDVDGDDSSAYRATAALLLPTFLVLTSVFGLE